MRRLFALPLAAALLAARARAQRRLRAPRSRRSRTTTCSSTTRPTGRPDAGAHEGARRRPGPRLGLLAPRGPGLGPAGAPDFNSADPAAYSPAAWARYDHIVRVVARHGPGDQLQRHLAGARLGDRQPRPAGPRAQLRARRDRVRQLRARPGHPLQRHVRPRRGPAAAAARRLLVDLERAQPGRLAHAAVGRRPGQPAPVHRRGPAPLPRAPRPRLRRRCWRPATATTRS